MEIFSLLLSIANCLSQWVIAAALCLGAAKYVFDTKGKVK